MDPPNQLYPRVVLPPLVHPLTYFNPESQQNQQQVQQLQHPHHHHQLIPSLGIPITTGSFSSTSSVSSGGSNTSTTCSSPPTLPSLRPTFNYTAKPPPQQMECCKWADCNATFETPQLLYSHLCDIHVGRKAKKNLALKCQWENCHVQVVKRDHITSHLRVHVALKPFACQSCTKKFKRPQDLKKHQRVHMSSSSTTLTTTTTTTTNKINAAIINNPPVTKPNTMPIKRPNIEQLPNLDDKRPRYTLPPLESILNAAPSNWPLPMQPPNRFQLRNNQQTSLDLDEIFAQIDLNDNDSDSDNDDSYFWKYYDPTQLEEGEIIDNFSKSTLYPIISV